MPSVPEAIGAPILPYFFEAKTALDHTLFEKNPYPGTDRLLA